MSLYCLVPEREHEPVHVAVAVIGAGKFATMFLARARRTPGLRVTAVCGLRPPRLPA